MNADWACESECLLNFPIWKLYKRLMEIRLKKEIRIGQRNVGTELKFSLEGFGAEK